MNALNPTQTTATYRVDCPHGCYGDAEVSVTRDAAGEILSIRVRCLGNTV